MHTTLPYGLRLSFISRAMKKQIDDCLRSKGLTGAQLFILGEIHRLIVSGKEEICQRDLERLCHVSHPTMTDLLARLEKKGYIVQCQSSHDKRQKSISVTEEARSLERMLSSADELAFSKLSAGLSEEEVRLFIALSDRMLHNALKELGHDDLTIPERKRL